MGMLIRRRIHEMQNQSAQKDVDSAYEFEATEIQEGNDIEEKSKDKLTYEDLSNMTVKQIKEIAEQKGFTLNKIIKEDVISEFLSKQ